MTRNNQRIWVLLTFIFAVGIIAITFPQILTNSGHVIPGLGGDSGKNLFAYLYHILYDKGYWFTGMNYPYGEHIVYMDGQPLLSVTLSYFRNISIAQGLAIMWGAILLSYILAIIYVYKILLHFGVKPFAAMIFSGLIAIMNPQLFRTLGHFGLSYVCVIPMLFYWTVKYDLNARGKYALYILILGLLATFLHPYFSAIILLWVSFYTAGYFIFMKAKWQQKLKHVLPLILSVISLLAVTGIIMRLTDPIKDRASTPYGLTVYCVRGEQIFTSHYSPVWRYLEDHTGFIKNSAGDEGFTYLGLIVIAAFVFSLIKGLINRKKNSGEPNIFNKTGFKPIWLFIAFASLLVSMGVPFVWHMEWIVNYLSFLRQFRTLGRFSWIFYYIITIYGVVIIYKYYNQCLTKGKIIPAYCILIFAMTFWSFEAGGYINAERTALNDNGRNYDVLCGKNGGNWQQFLFASHYKPGDFQAILLLRFFNEGSDKLWLGGDALPMEMGEGFVTGMQLHLPIVDAMAHSSWAIAEKQVKIAGGPYVYKPMLNDLPNNKPFLLLNYARDKLDPDQEYLFAAADSIGSYNGWRVYACYPDRIKANDKKYTDSIKSMIPYLKNDDTCIRCSGTWYIDHFDLGKAQEKFFGNGALPQIMQRETVIANIPVQQAGTNVQYEFSCWFLLGNENYKSPYFKLDFMDATGNIISTKDVLTKESTDNKGLWFRAFAFFSMPLNCSSIKCRLFNDPDNAYKVIDEMQLRPVNGVIISKSESGDIMVNNHLLAQ